MDKDNCVKPNGIRKDEMIRLALLEVRVKDHDEEINKIVGTQETICKTILQIKHTFYGAIGLYVVVEGNLGNVLLGIKTLLS